MQCTSTSEEKRTLYELVKRSAHRSQTAPPAMLEKEFPGVAFMPLPFTLHQDSSFGNKKSPQPFASRHTLSLEKSPLTILLVAPLGATLCQPGLLFRLMTHRLNPETGRPRGNMGKGRLLHTSRFPCSAVAHLTGLWKA